MKFWRMLGVETMWMNGNFNAPALSVCAYPLPGCGGENIWASDVSSTLPRHISVTPLHPLHILYIYPYKSHAVPGNQAPPASFHTDKSTIIHKQHIPIQPYFVQGLRYMAR